MNVEKSISPKEIEVIIRKHFEREEGVKLNDFKISSTSDGSKISYNTDLIPPTIADKAKEKLASAKGVFNTLFSKN